MANDPAIDRATAIPSSGDGDFRIACVLRHACAVLYRNFWIFLPISAIAASPNLIIFSNSYRNARFSPAYLLALFSLFVLGALSQAVLLQATLQDISGRPVLLGEALRNGLERLLPIMGVAIATTLGCILGALLLVVPALILWVRWYVAVPVCVVEHLGPIRSIDRSQELTRGYRWQISGLCLLFLIFAVIVGTMSFRLLPAPLAAIGIWVSISVASSFGAVVVILTFIELRRAKEGIGEEQVAVFDRR